MQRSASLFVVPQGDVSAEHARENRLALIEEHGERKAASPLTEAGRREREDAVRFANASIGLEGFRVSAEEQALSDRFIAGEIDLAEFLSSK